jgi:hypothetical protein
LVLGQYSETDILQKEFLADLPAARQRLSQYKTLDTLFSSFRGYENKEYEKTRNIFVRWCLPFHANEAKLGEVEEALVFFDALNWRQDRRDCLKQRMCSDDFYVSLTQYTELAYARWLAEKIGKDKVEIYPTLTTGKISDILVKMDSKNVYLELGNLSESLPERKIQKVSMQQHHTCGQKLAERFWLLRKLTLLSYSFRMLRTTLMKRRQQAKSVRKSTGCASTNYLISRERFTFRIWLLP